MPGGPEPYPQRPDPLIGSRPAPMSRLCAEVARIRSIKPEFPQSESMGRVSRDARLLFVQLWTICDDSGVTRANSRILASLLYPYDDDANNLMDSWIAELEREQCVARYVVDGATYLQILHWADHQKIDKPTPSRLPKLEDGSRILPSESREPPTNSPGIGRDRKGKEVDQVAPPARVDEPPPENLDTEAWNRWIDYRKQIRKPIKPVSVLAAQKELAGFGSEQSAVVAHSVANGYQGLFAPKRANGSVPPAERPRL